jgi:hypothetical protein
MAEAEATAEAVDAEEATADEEAMADAEATVEAGDKQDLDVSQDQRDMVTDEALLVHIEEHTVDDIQHTEQEGEDDKNGLS